MRTREVEEKSKSPKKKIIVIAVFLAAAVTVYLILSTIWARSTTDTVILRCNGVNITQSIYQMYFNECATSFKQEAFPNASTLEYEAMTDEEKLEYNNAQDSFWTTAIDGVMPIDIVKAGATDALKEYAYYTIECNNNNIALTDEEKQALRSVIEAQFQGVDIEAEFDVKEEYFVNYMVEEEKFSRFTSSEIMKINVGENQIKELFDENRMEYAKATVKTVFLKNTEENSKEENKASIDELKAKLTNGENTIDELITQYSKYTGNDNGKFIVNKSSTVESVLGSEYIEDVLNSNEGDIRVVETETGYCLNQTVKIERTSNADNDLKYLIQDEIYHNQVYSKIQNKEYDLVIIEQELFDSVGLPGVFIYDEEE